jgi:hypothetical protein
VKEFITAEEARRLGYVVDDTVWPWVAYKGPRFRPTEWQTIATPAFPQIAADS